MVPTMNPGDENIVSVIEDEVKDTDSKATNLEGEVKDMEQDDAGDFDGHVSTGRRKMIILSDDEDSSPSASAPGLSMENEDDNVCPRKNKIGSDSESEDGGLFNMEQNTTKPKVRFFFLIFFFTSFCVAQELWSWPYLSVYFSTQSLYTSSFLRSLL